MSDLISNLASIYTKAANNFTDRYEKVFGLTCDLYFPINPPNPNPDGTYDDINLYATHGLVKYNTTADATDSFYIPFLLKKEIMNSPEDMFDTFYNDEGEYAQPFIECAYSKELPIMTKVGVHLGEATVYLMVSRKTVVNLGCKGHALLRQFLEPMVGELSNE